MRTNDMTQLVRSPHLVVLQQGGEHVAYHALLGNPMVLDAPSYAVLDAFATPRDAQEACGSLGGADTPEKVQEFIDCSYLVHPDVDERSALRERVLAGIARITGGENFSALGLILDEHCNFGCDFCVARKLKDASGLPGGQRRMTWAVAQRAIDAYARVLRAHHRSTAEIYFGGREPLLNWDVFRRGVEYALETYGTEFTFSFATNTNGSLVTPEKAAFLAQHRVVVTSSLDGLEEANDSVRTYASGRGTYRKILAGWDALSHEGLPIQQLSLTLTDGNIDAIDGAYFDHLQSRGIRSCTVEFDIVAPLARSPESVAATLLRLRALAQERGVEVTGMWEKPFKQLCVDDAPALFNCNAFMGIGLNVQPSGGVAICSYSAQALGTIDDLEGVLRSPAYGALVASRAAGSIEACRGCEIEGLCKGGCYLTTEYGTYTSSTEAFRYRCDVYRIMTRALLLESAATT